MALINYLRWTHRIFYRIRVYGKQLVYSYKYYYTKRLALCCDIRCGINYVGKKSTKFAHPVGCVLGMGVTLGQNCIIFQNVTIGTKSVFEHDYPTIGDNVIVGANSVVVGNITIGDGATIGACSLVNKDIPPKAIAVGIPVKIIGYNA